jgi:hypothetical protein
MRVASIAMHCNVDQVRSSQHISDSLHNQLYLCQLRSFPLAHKATRIIASAVEGPARAVNRLLVSDAMTLLKELGLTIIK